MPRAVTQNIPNPDDATNGVAVGVTIQFTRTDSGVVIRVDYPQDPGGAEEFPLSALPAGDRTKVRDMALAVLNVYKTRRGYV